MFTLITADILNYFQIVEHINHLTRPFSKKLLDAQLDAATDLLEFYNNTELCYVTPRTMTLLVENDLTGSEFDVGTFSSILTSVLALSLGSKVFLETSIVTLPTRDAANVYLSDVRKHAFDDFLKIALMQDNYTQTRNLAEAMKASISAFRMLGESQLQRNMLFESIRSVKNFRQHAYTWDGLVVCNDGEPGKYKILKHLKKDMPDVFWCRSYNETLFNKVVRISALARPVR